MHLKGNLAFQNAYNYIFSRKPEIFLGFTSKVRLGFPNNVVFLPMNNILSKQTVQTKM